MSSKSQGVGPANTIPNEELRIRDELEADIEEDLEREIIDDMCRHARHLQRLYQQKDRRERTDSAANSLQPSQVVNKVLTEINIRIKLDGQCKINITKVRPNNVNIQQKLQSGRNGSPNIAQLHSKGQYSERQNDTVIDRNNSNHPIVPWK